MHFNFEIIKKHKIAFGIGGVALFVIFYKMFSDSSSGSSSSDTSTSSSTNQYDVELANISAQSQAAQLSASTQLQVAQLQASATTTQYNDETQVALAQTTAALEATKDTNANNLAITQSNNNTSLGITQSNNNTTLGLMESMENAQTQQHADTIAYLLNQTNQQANVATTISNNQTQIANKTLDLVGQAGLNHGTSTLENSLVQIVETANGNVAGSVAAAQAGSGSFAKGDSNVSGIIGSIGGAASNVLAAIM